MSPEMVSRTVQVRVRPPLPASTGPSSDTSVSTSREPGGTGVVYILGVSLNAPHLGHDSIYGVYLTTVHLYSHQIYDVNIL